MRSLLESMLPLQFRIWHPLDCQWRIGNPWLIMERLPLIQRSWKNWSSSVITHTEMMDAIWLVVQEQSVVTGKHMTSLRTEMTGQMSDLHSQMTKQVSHLESKLTNRTEIYSYLSHEAWVMYNCRADWRLRFTETAVSAHTFFTKVDAVQQGLIMSKVLFRINLLKSCLVFNQWQNLILYP